MKTTALVIPLLFLTPILLAEPPPLFFRPAPTQAAVAPQPRPTTSPVFVGPKCFVGDPLPGERPPETGIPSGQPDPQNCPYASCVAKALKAVSDCIKKIPHVEPDGSNIEACRQRWLQAGVKPEVIAEWNRPSCGRVVPLDDLAAYCKSKVGGPEIAKCAAQLGLPLPFLSF